MNDSNVADQLGSALRHLRGVLERLDTEDKYDVGNWMCRFEDAHPDMWAKMNRDDLRVRAVWRELRTARKAVNSPAPTVREVDLESAIAEAREATKAVSALIAEEKRLVEEVASARSWWLAQMSKIDPERWIARRERKEQIERAKKEIAAIEALLKEAQ